MDQYGLVAPNSVVREGEKLVARAETGMRDIAGAGDGIEAAARIKKTSELTSTERHINTLNSVSSKAFIPFNLEMLGASSMMPIMPWIARMIGKTGWKKGQVGVETPFTAAPAALRSTELRNYHQVPGAIVENMSKLAEQAGATEMAERLTQRSARWAQKGAELHQSAKGMAAPVTQPVTHFFKKNFTRLHGSKQGQRLSQWLSQLGHKRIDQSHVRFGKALGDVHASLTAQTPGWFARTVLRRQPTPIALADSLKPIEAQIAGLQGLHGAQAQEAIVKITQNIEAITLKDKGVATHATAIATKLARAGSIAGNHEALSLMAKEGTPGLLKYIGHSAGRVSVFSAIIGLGVAAGAGALLLSAKHQNREGKKALREMADDIGDTNHPIIKEAKKVHGRQSVGRWGAAGLNSLGQAALIMPQGGVMGGIAMASMMGGSQLAQVIVPDNMLLNAYATLKQAEQGKIQVEPAQKIYYMRQLVGAVPAVANQGGVYNKLAQPLAEAIYAKKLNVRDTMRLLADPEKFTALAGEVAEKQKKSVEEQKAKTAAQKPAAPTASVAPQTDKPSLTISKSADMHQGRVSGAQRAIQA